MRRSSIQIVLSHMTALRALRAYGDVKSFRFVQRSTSLPKSKPSEHLAQQVISHLEFDLGFGLDPDDADPPSVIPLDVMISTVPHRTATESLRLHTHFADMPPQTLIELATGIYSVTPEVALVQVASCVKKASGSFAYMEADPCCSSSGALSPLDWLMIAWEVCGRYQTPLTGGSSHYDIPMICTLQQVYDAIDRMKGTSGAKSIKRLVKYLADGSASPRETQLALLLGLPRKHGGYGLGIPAMNHVVEASSTASGIAAKTFFKCDLCWPAQKIGVEYQSFEFHGNEQSRIGDSRRAKALKAMGWDVIEITDKELNNPRTMDGIASMIRRMLGKRTPADPDGFNHVRTNRQLRKRLALPNG